MVAEGDSRMAGSCHRGYACLLEVEDRLKPGFSEYALLGITTHSLGYFSSYRVTRTSCTIR